jgi:DNA-3-methyladenine glycosylase
VIESFNILNNNANTAAKLLLGCEFERTIGNKIIRVRIVETEAYDQADAASHSYKGMSPRTKVMFDTPGHLYVYFIYGMHYCCNIVVGPEGYGAAVLIRAVEPLSGICVTEKNRGRVAGGLNLTNGPAKLCKALAIDNRLNGHYLADEPLKLILNKPLPKSKIVQTTRLGITKAVDLKLRFYIKGNQYISKV